jgi:hypothetical protein
MDYVFKDFYENFQREVYWKEQTFYYMLYRLTDHLMRLPAEQTLTPISFPYLPRPLDPNERIEIGNKGNTQTIPQPSPQVELTLAEKMMLVYKKKAQEKEEREERRL